jgi:hypothetical protein
MQLISSKIINICMHITITGDSWGYYWDEQGNCHTGLERILKKKAHTVTNLAVPGTSNQSAVDRLLASTAQTDLVLFIQTEPIREWFVKNSVDHSGNHRAVIDAEELFKQAVAKGSMVAVLTEQLQNNVYQALSQWQTQHQVPVLMIGGCSGVDPKLLPKNLICAVPSWPLLLLGQDKYKETMFQDTAQWLSFEYADIVHESKNIDLIVEWYEITKLVTVKQSAWFNDNRYFTPDNWHPNFKGHKILVNSLEQYFTGTAQNGSEQ